ncbi:lasso peptide biosynthesis B2 protein [Priestia megaterium]|uniref:lasso peptide biosynthesis B2 protein n=1 Tax=Priestia megaterium TaxID=1404 RepID=UPI0022816DFC|nr:lasso peptide biosynthesis B2 protein [Priestia megaterium]MCY9026858.1 lasso peptide biosynthesis B2 protein [Priestia megaterium]
MLKKIKGFMKYDNRTKLLLLETFFVLGWARILKSIPFSKVAPYLGEKSVETLTYTNEEKRSKLNEISKAIEIMSRHTLWESKCLVQAMAAMNMLKRRQIESTLYMGMAKDEQGALIAHAWLRSGSFYVTGSEGMERFTVVGTFANNVSNKRMEGEVNG